MEAAAGQDWFLRKHEEGSIFGPLPFAQLARWASSAQVAPHDAVSTDQRTWTKAPMLPELGMDWLVEVTTNGMHWPQCAPSASGIKLIGSCRQCPGRSLGK